MSENRIEQFEDRLRARADKIRSADPESAALLSDAARRVESLKHLTEAYDTRHKEMLARAEVTAQTITSEQATPTWRTLDKVDITPRKGDAKVPKSVKVTAEHDSRSKSHRGQRRPLEHLEEYLLGDAPDPEKLNKMVEKVRAASPHPLTGLWCAETSRDPEITRFGWHHNRTAFVQSVVGDVAMLQFFSALDGCATSIKPIPLTDLLSGEWLFFTSYEQWVLTTGEASRNYWDNDKRERRQKREERLAQTLT